MRHYRRRRNPILGGGGRFSTILEMGGGGVVGFLAARMLPQNFLAQYNTGIMGYFMNAVAGGVSSFIVGDVLLKNRNVTIGGYVGTAVAVAARVITENFSATGAATAMSGDLDFDLGYYVSDRFPFPQDAGGPFNAFPGTPYLANPPFPTTSAAAVRAGAAAAAALPATASSPAQAEAAGRRWDNSRWS
jgi:hypothetical protein